MINNTLMIYVHSINVHRGNVFIKGTREKETSIIYGNFFLKLRKKKTIWIEPGPVRRSHKFFSRIIYICHQVWSK